MPSHRQWVGKAQKILLNLIIDAVLKYNTYGMLKSEKITYGELNKKTYKEIREDEL